MSRSTKVASSASGLPRGVSATEVRQQLRRILSAGTFARAERLSRFLEYSVEQALAGNAHQIKEYSIAVEVFDKPASFDTRADTIVRVEAGRLRSKVLEYYDTDGRSDPLWVGLRKRGYRPLIRKRDGAPKASSRPAAPASASAPPVQAGNPDSGLDQSRAIVVLPFADLSAQQNQEFFCDALAQQITSQLAKVPGLRVVGRTTAFQYKKRHEDLRRIGDSLSVGRILEGAVQRAGDRVRVSVQLVSASNGLDLWAEVYDRPLDDIFALQDEISGLVVGALRERLIGREPQASLPSSEEDNCDIYRDVLSGIYHLDERTEDEVRKSIEHFNRAIKKQPQYAPAHAGLAVCYAVLAISSAVAPGDVMPLADQSAAAALQLDRSSAKARAVQGLVRGLYSWDRAAARVSFEQALALNPGLSLVHHWIAIGHWLPAGNLDFALAEMTAAHKLNPSSGIISAHLGLVHYMRREPALAIERFEKAIERDADFYRAWWDLGRVHHHQENFDEALKAYERARQLSRGSFRVGALGRCYAAAGKSRQARKLLKELRDRRTAGSGYVAPFDLAEIYFGLGEVDNAFDALDEAVADRSPWLNWIAADPLFDDYRGDPRFQALLDKLSLKVPVSAARA